MRLNKWYLDRMKYSEKICLDENTQIVTIGRGKENVINCLSLFVSRKHCIISYKDQDSLVIKDLKSSNGTFVNETQIIANREIPLEPGDLIGIGVTETINEECYVYKLLKVEAKPALPPPSPVASSTCSPQSIVLENVPKDVIVLSDSEEEKADEVNCKNDVPCKIDPWPSSSKMLCPESSTASKCKSEISKEDELNSNSIRFSDSIANVTLCKGSTSGKETKFVSSKLEDEDSKSLRVSSLSSSLECKSESILNTVHESDALKHPVNSVIINGEKITVKEEVIATNSDVEIVMDMKNDKASIQNLKGSKEDKQNRKDGDNIHVTSLPIFSGCNSESITAQIRGELKHPANSMLNDSKNAIVKLEIIECSSDEEILIDMKNDSASQDLKQSENKWKTSKSDNMQLNLCSAKCEEDNVSFMSSLDKKNFCTSTPMKCEKQFSIDTTKYILNNDSATKFDKEMLDVVVIDSGEECELEERKQESKCININISSPMEVVNDETDENITSVEKRVTKCTLLESNSSLEKEAPSIPISKLEPLSSALKIQPVTNAFNSGDNITVRICKAEPFVKLERLDEQYLKKFVNKEISSAECDSHHNYTMEDDIIIISDAEDDLPVNMNANNDDNYNKYDAVEDDDHGNSDSDSDNDWWPKLSQSFLESLDLEEKEFANKNKLKRQHSDDSDSEIFSSRRKKKSKEMPWLIDSEPFDDDNGGRSLNDIKFVNDKLLFEPGTSSRESVPIVLTCGKEDSIIKVGERKTTSSRQIMLIDPPHIPPKRSGHKLVEKPSLSRRISKPSSKIGEKSSRLRRRSSSSGDSGVHKPLLSPNEKKIITDIRKERLKAIAEQAKQSSSNDQLNKPKANIRVKNTKLSRADILVEDLNPSSSVPGQMSKSSKSSKTNSSSREKHSKSKSEKTLNSVSKLTEEVSKSRELVRVSVKDLPRIPRIKGTSVESSTSKNCEILSNIYAKSDHSNHALRNLSEKRTSYNDKPEAISESENNRAFRSRNLESGKVESTDSRLQNASIQDINSNKRSILYVAGAPKASKKRVSFKNESELCQTKYIPVENFSSLRPVVGSKDAPVHRNILTSTSRNLAMNYNMDDAIYTICNWNIRWLQEQKGQKKPPPCYGPVSLCPMLTKFSSYDDYYKVVNPLMLLSLWGKVGTEMESGYSHHRSQVHLAIIDSVEEQIMHNSNKIMVVKCHVLLTAEADRNQIHPYVGDLCQLDVFLDPHTMLMGESGEIVADSQGGSAQCIRLFTYIETLQKQTLNAASNSMWTGTTASPNPTCKVNLVMKMKYKECVKASYKWKLRVLCNIRPELRLFEAVAAVPDSSLHKMILNPSIIDYHLPSVDMKKSLALENQLSEAQKKAVLQSTAICLKSTPKICLIQGPPGTGKSTVIVNIIMQILYGRKQYQQTYRRSNRPQILLCAPSNAAIDELVCRLLQIRQTLPKGDRFRMVRAGRVSVMRPAVKEISLEDLSKRDIKQSLLENESLESVQIEVRNLEARRRSYETSMESAKARNLGESYYAKKIDAINRKLMQLTTNRSNSRIDPSMQRKMERDSQIKLLAKADIVASTLSSCCTPLVCEVFKDSGEGQPHFTCCIIDEATQCCEPEALLPLILGIETYVLVGDPEQLQATVVSKEAQDYGYGQSLFSRIWNTFNGVTSNPVNFLNVQHRMHAEICQWPNQFFYNNKIVTAPRAKIIWPLKPYIVLCLEFTQFSPSEIVNLKEAKLISQLAMGIRSLFDKNTTISIITPYQRQRSEIIRNLEESIASRCEIDVNTIDSFQGQECDVVLISCTRTEGVGFLTDMQRLNVALTRARQTLIVCGNFISLKKDGMWKDLILNASQRGLLVTMKGSDVPRKEDLMRFVLQEPAE